MSGATNAPVGTAVPEGRDARPIVPEEKIRSYVPMEGDPVALEQMAVVVFEGLVGVI
jgi:hypothetical protein